MSLTQQINDDIKAAMKAKEKEKLSALRDIKSKLLLEATSGGGEVSEDKEMKVVMKLHKQRMETYELYKEQGRDDLAEEEKFQADIIESYLPEMMSEDDIKAAVQAQIGKTGASGPQDMGKVMGPLSKELSGKADGKIIANIVKEELNK